MRTNPETTLPMQAPPYGQLQHPGYSVDGVMGGRVMAWIVDFVIVSMLTFVIVAILGVLGLFTFLLTWALIPVAAIGTLLAYSAITVGGPRQATIGMRMAGVRIERALGGRPDALAAAVHALLFYMSVGTIGLWFLNVVIGFLRRDKRMGHDILTGLVVIRR